MKSFYILLILFCAKLNLSAQDDDYKSLNTKYNRLRKEEKQDSALLLAKQLNAWILKNEGDTGVNYSMSCFKIGNSFFSLRHFDSAFYYYKFCLIKLKDQNKNKSLKYFDFAWIIAEKYQTINDFNNAELYYTQVLKYKREIFKDDKTKYLKDLNKVGTFYFKFGKLKASKEIFVEKLNIVKDNYSEESEEYNDACNNLAIVLEEIGENKESESLRLESIEREKRIGKTASLSYANLTHNLATYYHKNDKFREAKNLYLEALKVYEINKDTSVNYLTILTNVATLFKDMGDYDESKKTYLKALKLFQNKAKGNETIEYTNLLIQIGNLYYYKNKYQEAELSFIEALSILSKKYSNSSNYPIAIGNYGDLLRNKGDFINAEAYLKSSIDLKTKIYGPNNTKICSNLISLSKIYATNNNLTAALSVYNKSLEITKAAYGVMSIQHAKDLSGYSILLAKANENNEAFSSFNLCFEIINKDITLNFEWLNDKEKELYWNKNKFFYNSINQFATNNTIKFPQVNGLNYNSNLFTKGKLLEAKISKENDLAEIVELREKLSFIRKKLAKLDENDDVKHYNKLDEEANLLDSKLTQLWSEYANQKKNLSITWNQVQKNLTENEAAIEFARYKSDKDSQFYYNALIVRKTDVYPILVPLCSENQLKGILNKGFSAYYPLVWAPMDGYLKEIKTIYYSPVGLLNTIPFAALYPQKNGGDEVTFDKKTKKIVSKTESDANYLMNRYTLHQLSSTRYLAMGLKENSTNKIDKSIALIGGVNYDFIPGESKKTIKKEMQLASREANISKPLEYLQGTKIEVETIGKSMQKNGWSTSLLENDSATEDNLIKFENQAAKGILHIATHGFAFPNIKELPPNSDSSISNNNFCYYTNPLQRCGLILAGANWTWMGRDDLKNKNPEAEDGILTAAQVALLNLRKTKLVVLSACETGLGKIEGSEGVIGLTRAFKLAGVEQLIVSLWEVPDKETMELMTIFYEDLSRTQNAIISFEKAQKIMSLKYPTRPDMWAGFVLIR